MKLRGKVAIVTGASRGIGRAIALAFAREGAAVTVAARTETESGPLGGTIHKTTADVRALGGRTLAIRTDVSNEPDVEEMVRKTLEEFGRIDILVNNAGVGRPASFLDLPVRSWDLIMKVNLRGPFLCIKAVLPTMIRQGGGNIINVSSVAARRPHEPKPGIAYCVSKAALDRVTWGLAEELTPYNIAINGLAPSNTETEGWSYWTPGIDKSDWQRPDLWGEFAVFLATREAKAFTGKTLTEEELRQECSQAGWKL